jgi:GDPmannose 4,6-dehydratase
MIIKNLPYKALILGVTGQDGSYLADLLLEKGYEVHGLYRKSATGNTINIRHLTENPSIFNKRFFLHRGDLLDVTSLYRVIGEVRPREIYNEADQDHVRWSYDMIGYSSDITGGAVAKILEIIRQLDPSIRFFQPCTSNMYGMSETELQDEKSPFNPQSPYAVAKTFAYFITRYYRQAFGMHASTAILFNHESPRRSTDYVTRKITQSVARIVAGKQDKLVLGDLSAKIDWGFAGEYMESAWRMLQSDSPDDFVIASGEAHSVKEFVDAAFAVVGLDSEKYVETNETFLRPTKTSTLIGNINKAQKLLDFNPKIRFNELVKLMVNADLERER